MRITFRVEEQFSLLMLPIILPMAFDFARLTVGYDPRIPAIDIFVAIWGVKAILSFEGNGPHVDEQNEQQIAFNNFLGQVRDEMAKIKVESESAPIPPAPKDPPNPTE